jgi:hypothetical protein
MVLLSFMKCVDDIDKVQRIARLCKGNLTNIARVESDQPVVLGSSDPDRHKIRIK